jgi:hypothetical protein
MNERQKTIALPARTIVSPSIKPQAKLADNAVFLRHF